MKQLEIQFFWPLTEQTNLDLDFSPSTRYLEESTCTYSPHMHGAISIAPSSGTISSSFEIKPNNKTVGHYKVHNTSFHIHCEKKPNALTRWAMKYVFNFIWKDNA